MWLKASREYKEKHKEEIKKYQYEYYRKWKLKIRARKISRREILNGKIIKGKCRYCGSEKNIDGHHPNYNKPLKIIWLCRLHHRQLHHGIIKI